MSLTNYVRQQASISRLVALIQLASVNWADLGKVMAMNDDFKFINLF